MNHEHEQSHATSSATAARRNETSEPGQASRSAFLHKPDQAVASGLVQRKARDANGVAGGAEHSVAAASSSRGSPLLDAGVLADPEVGVAARSFSPPKEGVTTTTVWLRGAPMTGPTSPKIRTFKAQTFMSVSAEVKSKDRAYPRWVAVEVDKKAGYMAADFVTLSEKPKDLAGEQGRQENTTGGASAGAKPPAPAPAAPDNGGEFMSGNLARMRREGQFEQQTGRTGTLYKSIRRAYEATGFNSKEAIAKAKSFGDEACNVLAMFMMVQASAIRAQNSALKDDYPAFKSYIENALTDFLVEGFKNNTIGYGNIVKDKNGNVVKDKKGNNKLDTSWVKTESHLNMKLGATEGTTPFQKALDLLRCEGRLIVIHVKGHYFIGEVKGGFLHASDNQGDEKKRSGRLDLNEVKEDTKDGETYKYLKHTLISANAEKTNLDRQAEAQAAEEKKRRKKK